MLNDTLVDTKLQQLSHEIRTHAFVPACKVEDAFAMRGVDGSGRAGIFAAILLQPGPAPALNELMTFRAQLAQRLRQLDAKMPTWPIIVPGAPETTGSAGTLPGGRAYFEKVKLELTSYQQKLKASPAKATLAFPTFLDTEALRPLPSRRRHARTGKAQRTARAPSRRTKRAQQA